MALDNVTFQTYLGRTLFMIGIIIQLIISWLLLWLIERKDLSVLGLKPTPNRIKDLVAGIIFPLVYFTLLFLTIAYQVRNPYVRNSGYTTDQFLKSLWYLFKSVSFETLIFQGALLYIMIQRIGKNKAVLIGGVAFGIYHWFSWNLFGQPATMIIVFFTTGVAGYLWSMAFAITRSIYLPFALHFGVDIVNSIVFSKDKNMGNQFLVQSFEKDPQAPGTIISIIMLILYFVGFPLLTLLYFKKKKRQSFHSQDECCVF